MLYRETAGSARVDARPSLNRGSVVLQNCRESASIMQSTRVPSFMREFLRAISRHARQPQQAITPWRISEQLGRQTRILSYIKLEH